MKFYNFHNSQHYKFSQNFRVLARDVPHSVIISNMDGGKPLTENTLRKYLKNTQKHDVDPASDFTSTPINKCCV